MKDYFLAKIENEEEVLKVDKNTTLFEISEKYKENFKNPILAAIVNNQLQELGKTLTEDGIIKFLDLTDTNGFRVYQRSLALLMICAVKEILGNKTRVTIEHSINKNYYCLIISDEIIITNELIKEIEERMKLLVIKNYPIEKLSLNIETAEQICEEMGLYDKLDILKFRRTSNVNFYKLSWFYDYFYGQLAPSTGVLTNFKLVKQGEGFILQFPDFHDASKLTELKPFEKISNVFKESSNWAKILKIDTVGPLNKKISNGEIGNIIRISEALHEKKTALIADMIFENKKRIVLIAGPSSSGKTTFAHRLSIQIRVNGFNTHIISMDDYFKNQDFTPGLSLDEEYDFESIDAVDVKQLNIDIEKLLNNEKVNIPSFNFATGKREDKKRYLQIQENDILIIEGIHGLNKNVLDNIEKNLKFKVFISALTQLNIDDHNRIPTSDTRLLRRIVRDHQFRKLDAGSTIKMWPQVTKGESNNIFPFQEEADAIFNSALVYELCVLKQFVEPILFNIEKSQKEFVEARRLIKFLDSFIGVNSEEVPSNSIIREFIGGSCFK